MLKRGLKNNCLEAGLDEAGRGCLAGPVFAAAVILPPGFKHPLLRDSKTLSALQREKLRDILEREAQSFSVQQADENTIDRLNILKASIHAMHLSVSQLGVRPGHLLIDGNFFIPFPGIPHQTVVKGDNTYMNIAAASILAKTHRDEWMKELHKEFPMYGWDQNKGYGTRTHIRALKEFGLSPYHRRSFQVKSLQLELFQQAAQ